MIAPTPGDKRYVRRDDKGQFDEVDDVSRSLPQDVRKKAKKVAPKGQGDRGDQKRAGKKEGCQEEVKSTAIRVAKLDGPASR